MAPQARSLLGLTVSMISFVRLSAIPPKESGEQSLLFLLSNETYLPSNETYLLSVDNASKSIIICSGHRAIFPRNMYYVSLECKEIIAKNLFNLR